MKLDIYGAQTLKKQTPLVLGNELQRGGRGPEAYVLQFLFRGREGGLTKMITNFLF